MKPYWMDPLVSRYVYVKVNCWILRVVGGGPNGVGTYMAMDASGEPGFRN